MCLHANRRHHDRLHLRGVHLGSDAGLETFPEGPPSPSSRRDQVERTPDAFTQNPPEQEESRSPDSSSSSSSTLKEALEYCRNLQRPDGSWEGCASIFFVFFIFTLTNTYRAWTPLCPRLGPGVCVSPTASGLASKPLRVWVTSTRTSKTPQH